ncbi:MAG: hypothetical protein HFI87_02815 [Bacilli bacterium]|nr:hypothetical protein [Bacilli bacterium]
MRALHLFEKGEKLELEADRLEQEIGIRCDNYRQKSCFLRCEADEVESKFHQKTFAKK